MNYYKALQNVVLPVPGAPMTTTPQRDAYSNVISSSIALDESIVYIIN
jgi:hypothetical protein